MRSICRCLVAIQNRVGYKTEFLCDQDKLQINRYLVVLLHITIKITKQFAMNIVIVFTYNNTRLLLFCGYYIDNLKIDFMP